MILTDVDLQAVLVFVLLVTELAEHSRGRDVSAYDVSDQVFLAASRLTTGSTGEIGALVYHKRNYSLIVSEIYGIKMIEFKYLLIVNMFVSSVLSHSISCFGDKATQITGNP